MDHTTVLIPIILHKFGKIGSTSETFYYFLSKIIISFANDVPLSSSQVNKWVKGDYRYE